MAVIAGSVTRSTPAIGTVLIVLVLIAAVYIIARMYVGGRFKRRG